MDNYREIIFKTEENDNLNSGYFYNYYNGYNDFDPNNGKKYFVFSPLRNSSEGNKIEADKVSELDIEWWMYADQVFSKIKEYEDIMSEIANHCLNDKENSILPMIENHKESNFCSKCKNRDKCNHSEKWECIGIYPPKYYEEGDPEYISPYGNKTDSQLLSYIAKFGKLPKTVKS